MAQVRPRTLREPEGENGPAVPHWMKVARRLQELAADDSVDGIVVTHGTNVLAEVAYFMHLTVAKTSPSCSSAHSAPGPACPATAR